VAETSTPLVTVAMPVRNGMPFLPAALRSVLEQTYTNLDVLVIDDGSTDGTAGFLSRVEDPRLRVITTEGRGLVPALNLALASARGTFVARQDADDLSLPERIATQVAQLTAHRALALVACVADFIDEYGRPVTTAQAGERLRLQREAVLPQRLRELLPLTCCIVHGSVMARTDVLVAAGGYRESQGSAEDYDLWLRLLASHELAMLPDVLYRHRIHSSQVSERFRYERLRGTLRTKLEHLRAIAPQLPRPARTAIVGAGLGARIYAELCKEYDLALVEPTAQDEVDLTILANYADEQGRIRPIEPRGGWTTHGNFLVKAS
jgi:glycosyltransferase involved in cell wall biosynthesis